MSPTRPSHPQTPVAPPVGPMRTDEPTQPRPAPTRHRKLLLPPSASTTAPAAPRPHRRPRLRRGPALVVSLVVVLSGTLATSAAAAPATASAAAQPAPPAPPPAPSGQACTPDSSRRCRPANCPPQSPRRRRVSRCRDRPGRRPRWAASPGRRGPSARIPPAPRRPVPHARGRAASRSRRASPPPPTGPGAGQSAEGGTGDADCGITTLGGCVTNAITAFFRDVVTAALNPLLELLSTTLLTTPTPASPAARR